MTHRLARDVARQGGIMAGRPFVGTYMKDSIAEEQWERPWFKPACVTFTLFWLASFVVISISNTVGSP